MSGNGGLRWNIFRGVIPIPEQAVLEKALALLAERLEGGGVLWVVGGSTGLAMRGARLERPPRDLDLYADEEDAARMHALLAGSAVDEPTVSVTATYRSILSHYRIGDIAVELVGGFQVRTGRSVYQTEVRGALHPAGETRAAEGRPVRLAPLGHELIFNVLRGRPDRCLAAGDLIRRDPARHWPPLRLLLERNGLSPEDAALVRRYAGGLPSETDGRDGGCPR